jgi:hypothetical protein
MIHDNSLYEDINRQVFIIQGFIVLRPMYISK